MAGYDDWQRIERIGTAHGLKTSAGTYSLGQTLVAYRRSVRDLSHLFPDAGLKGRADEVNRASELCQLTIKISD